MIFRSTAQKNWSYSVKHELTEEIESILVEQCSARCLDDEEDFAAVMEVIEGTIEEWLDNRCPGCK